MPKTLTEFWSKLSTNKDALYVHPDDLDWFRRKRWDVQDQSVSSFGRFIRSDRFGKDDAKFHLSLLPVPFVGNLEKAKVIILLMNPGFSPTDYYAEEIESFRGACIRNLNQTNSDDDFPFYKLNPEFAWSGAFMWWEALLRPILVEIEKQYSFSYREALQFLANKIAAIELVPYHSVGANALNGHGNIRENLPSAIEARKLVQRLCGAKDRPLVLVLRSHKHWKLDAHPGCTCIRGLVLRRPTLNPKKGAAGRAILEKFGIDIA